MSKEVMTIRDSSEKDAGVTIVDVNDDLSGHTSIDFRNALDELASQGADKIVVNLSQTQHVNSAAIGALIGTAKKLRQSNGDLKVYGLGDSAKRIFDLVGVSTVLEIYESEKQALSAFSMAS